MAWLSGWSWAKEISLTGQTGAGTLYQVDLDIGDSAGGDFHLEGHCTNFPQDIEVTDNDGTTILDFSIEDITADPIKLWVEVADDLGSNQKVWVYYGKSGATTNSNIGNTFLLGDDFSDGDYTADPVWTVLSGSWTAAGYQLTPDGGANAHRFIRSAFTSTNSYVIEFKGLQWITFHLSDENNLYAIFSDGKFYKRVGGGWSLLTTFAGSFNTTKNTIKVVVSGATTTVYFGAESHADSTYNSGYMGFDGYTTADWGDDVRIRKYNSPEPAFSSAGSEQSAPVAGHPTMRRWGGIPGMQYTGRRSW